MSVIEVKNLSKTYNVFHKEPGFSGTVKSLFHRKYQTIHAVNDISFHIEEGELVGFIGPNGAGKTTTLKTLSGLLHPSGGEVTVLGQTPFYRATDFLKKISLVMGQKNQLLWDLPAMETLLLNKEIYEVPDAAFKEIIRDLSRILDAADFLHVQVKKLSLGQRMKMELMAALVHSPQVLFLDEPTIGLDVLMQKNLRDFVREYNRKYHATIILTSHYMEDVEQLCKRVIIINHGKILFDGALSELIHKHAPYKVITLILKEHMNPRLLEGLGEIVSFAFPQLVLNVPVQKANGVVGKLLHTLPVQDVTIEDPNIEDIIRDIFKEAIHE